MSSKKATAPAENDSASSSVPIVVEPPIAYVRNDRGKITGVEGEPPRDALKVELEKENVSVVVKRAKAAKLQEEIAEHVNKQDALENALRPHWRIRFATFCLWACSLGCYAGREDHHVARDAMAEEQKYEQGVLSALTAVIETASEGTDIWFTLTTLKNLTDPLLYTASISVLTLQAVLRFFLAMSPLVLFRGPRGKIFDQGSNPWQYLKGVVVTMVSPNNGVKIINEAMNLYPDDGTYKSNEYHAKDMVARIYQLQVALFAIGLVQVLAEDIPEALIDVLYLAQTDFQFASGELETFVTTATLTLISVIRGVHASWFAWKNIERVPRVLDNERTPLQKLLRGKKGHKANWFQRKVGWLLTRGRTPLDVLKRSVKKSDGKLGSPGCCDSAGTDIDLMEKAEAIREHHPEHKCYTPAVSIGKDALELMAWKWAGVQSLFLDGCGVVDEQGKEIAESLGGRTSLAQLSLSENQFSDESVKKFAKALTQNDTLTTLNLGGNQLTDETKTAIREAWGDRDFSKLVL
jgi:hypothetical protein